MHNIKRVLIFFLAFVLTTPLVSGTPKQNTEIFKQLKRLNKPYVKSIKSSDGDIFDCVKLTDQPAFDHPLLKNHTIQLSPTFDLEWEQSKKTNEEPITQIWQLSGSCLDGTEAVAYVHGGKYFGARGYMDVWNPQVHKDELSKSLISVSGSNKANKIIDSIEFGWHVNPRMNGDFQTREFLSWTNNGYKTICYNIQVNCPGFVQVTKGSAMGVVLKPYFTYGDNGPVAVDLSILQDRITGNWWLKSGKENIGYLPKSLFTHLQKGASIVTWGGRIKNYNYHSSHTTTQMGSGHFSNEGLSKASLITDIYIVDEHNKPKRPSLVDHMTRRECYDVKHIDSPTTTFLYFGGPGKNKYCR
ncbi:hypothetical protein ACFE04_009845 [Oxalis oulophora]